MNHESSPGVALVVVAVEALFFGWLCVQLVGSFTGHTDELAGTSVALRLLGIALAGGFALAPAWVYYDARRRGNSLAWVHATALPLLNVIGLVAYLANRDEAE